MHRDFGLTRNMHESRDLRLDVIKRMHHDASLVPTELRPLEHRQAKVDGSRIKGVDMTVKLKDFLYPPLACFRYHEKGELLEDAVIPLFVSLAKIAPGHGLPDSEVIDLTGMGFHRNDEIAQTFTV